MSIFVSVARDYTVTDQAFAGIEQRAFDQNDEPALDIAGISRDRNDHAYFLYLFTRFEAEVDRAVTALVAERTAPAIPWNDRRIWQSWARGEVQEIPFLAKVEVLLDRGNLHYAWVRHFYRGRNAISHGGEWREHVVVPDIAQELHQIANRFASA